jgi:uroporphyrinogen decarboxylase
VLAACTPEEVYAKTKEMIESVENRKMFFPSCGGGMPPNVSTENIRAFVKAVNEYSI